MAHDCGQIINPDGLTKTIEGNIVHITETPEAIDVVLINRPEMPPSGAGEPSIRPVAAAIANAIFDATGVRIRRVPFSPDRVKAALS